MLIETPAFGQPVEHPNTNDKQETPQNAAHWKKIIENYRVRLLAVDFQRLPLPSKLLVLLTTVPGIGNYFLNRLARTHEVLEKQTNQEEKELTED